MYKITELIKSKAPDSLSDYFALDAAIEKIKKNNDIIADKHIKIALLSSFTTKGIKEILNVKCCALGVLTDFYISAYNQYAQDIYNPQSSLYSFSPDLTILFVDTQSFWGNDFFEGGLINNEKKTDFIGMVNTLEKGITGTIVIHNFEIPTYSPFGILENKQPLGFICALRSLNEQIENLFKPSNRVFVLDYEAFCSFYGKGMIHDPKMYYLGDIKLGFDYFPKLCHEYMGYIKPLMSLSKKCIVLDLDNTLWGGIVGEDGFDGIVIGPTSKGRPFVEFQQHLLQLYNRGIILVVNSRNNFEDAIKVIREHPSMVLRESHFAAMRINWQDKASNIKEIAKEINIGTESMVFFDDDQMNRAIVKEILPEVMTVDLPKDPSLYVSCLQSINDFNVLQITDEDKKKGKMYAEQKERDQVKKESSDMADFLKRLNIIVKMRQADSFTIPRISQLTQKTNQFNMTTKRYLEEDITKFSRQDDYYVISAKVEDRFGDNGITGVVILKKEQKRWDIDTFLLSCRVLGRGVEQALLWKIFQYAREKGINELSATFIRTKKNKPAEGFYAESGFEKIFEEADTTKYLLDLNKTQPKQPKYIKMVED